MIKAINTTTAKVLKIKAVPCTLKENVPKALTSNLLPENEQQIWSDEVVQLVQDLKDTADSLGENCVGLASTQIWDKNTPPPAVFIVKKPYSSLEPGTVNYVWKEFINPVITTSGKTLKHKEACFSKPGQSKLVKREFNTTIEYSTLESKEKVVEKYFYKNSFISIVLQHEYDHLCGKLI